MPQHIMPQHITHEVSKPWPKVTILEVALSEHPQNLLKVLKTLNLRIIEKREKPGFDLVRA